MPEIDFAAILAEDKALAPSVETKTDAQTEKPNADTVTAPVIEAPAPTEAELAAAKQADIDKRFAKITAKRKEAERSAQAATERAEAAERRLQFLGKQDDPFDPSKFANLEDRDKAVRDQARREAEAELTVKQGNAKRDSFRANLEKDGKDIDGFDDVVETLFSPSFKVISPTMADFLMDEADHPALMAKWLTDNEDEAKRISELHPVKAVKELVRRDGLLGKTAKPVTKAPPPPPSVSGSSRAPAGIETMSHDDIKKWAKEAQRR